MNGWIGVDLDGTLAEYHGWNGGEIGVPVPAMVERVRNWLEDGIDVRIFTARVFPGGRVNPFEKDGVISKIQDWCRLHIGMSLPVTCVKDFSMIELWDDRCIHVEANTGRILG